MNGKLALLFALSALVLASTGCASKCKPRCCPPRPAPYQGQAVPCQPPITRFTLTNDSGETISGVTVWVAGQSYSATQNMNDPRVWTANPMVDDVTTIRASFYWHNGIHLVSKTETITLQGNTSTNPFGFAQGLPLYFKTIDLTLHDCAAGTFSGTLELSIGNTPESLRIP